jgi:WD40 repeat protein
MQRFFSALRDVALERVDTPVVIFIDEIDATRSLPFSANEFFAGIRECYNRRVHDGAYKRLTFCLLGVAVPGDLMAETTTTPFNIGERIVLTDFSPQEAATLAPGLGSGGNAILERILHWTAGHPFLTQSLAATAATRQDVHSAGDVDRLVADLLFQAKARETNINLADVGNRILNGYSDPDQISKYRADVLSLYEKALRGGEVFDDESNRLVTVLKLAGIVRVEDRKLKVRNRIYERVFDKTWVRENMPGAELRRQRRAFIRGALRTAAVAAIILALIAGLAWKAVQERNRANYEVYVATMNLLGPTFEQNNLVRMQDLLDATKDNPARGWEWDYWNHMAHLEVAEYPNRLLTFGIRFAPNGKLYVREGKIREYSPDTGAIVDLMPMLGPEGGMVKPFVGGTRLLEYDGGQTVQVIDVPGRRRLTKLENFGFWTDPGIGPDGRWIVAGRVGEFQGPSTSFRSAVLWDLETGQSTTLPTPAVREVTASPNGQMIAASELDSSGGALNFRAVVREFGSWKILASFETEGPTETLRFSPDNGRLATSTRTGWIQLWDLKSRREVARTRATDGVAYYLEFSADGSWLAVTSVDRVGRLYDVSGPQITLLETFRDAGWLSISPDRSRIAASYSNLRVYDPKTYVETPTAIGASEREINNFAVLAAKAPAYARSGNRVYEVDPISGRSVELTWFSGKPYTLPVSGESWGIVQRNETEFEIVDFETHRSVLSVPKDERTLQAVEQPPGGRLAILFYDQGSFDVWDTLERRILKKVRTDGVVVDSRTSPDGRWLATPYLAGQLSLWDTSTWTERRLPRAGPRAWNVAFSPDGSRLLATDAGRDTIEVWDVRSGNLIGRLTGHSGRVEDAEYSADGTRIVSASDDHTVRIWDAMTFRELTSLRGHSGFVIRARFTGDGSTIVSIDDKGNAKMWLTKTPPGLVAPAASAAAP